MQFQSEVIWCFDLFCCDASGTSHSHWSSIPFQGLYIESIIDFCCVRCFVAGEDSSHFTYYSGLAQQPVELSSDRHLMNATF